MLGSWWSLQDVDGLLLLLRVVLVEAVDGLRRLHHPAPAGRLWVGRCLQVGADPPGFCRLLWSTSPGLTHW